MTTPLTQTALVTELQTDPASVGYATPLASGNCHHLIELMTSPNPAWSAVVEPVPLWTVISWLIQNNLLVTILSDNAHGSAAAFKALYNNPSLTSEDTHDPGFQMLVAGFVADGLITTEQQTAVNALANRSPASRAEVLWGPGAAPDLNSVGLAVRTINGW